MQPLKEGTTVPYQLVDTNLGLWSTNKQVNFNYHSTQCEKISGIYSLTDCSLYGNAKMGGQGGGEFEEC